MPWSLGKAGGVELGSCRLNDRYRQGVRRAAVVAGFAVIVVGAVLATVALGGRGGVVSSGSVLCEKDGVRILTPRVVVQEDGLHLRVVNVGRDRRYEVASAGSTPVAGVLAADGVLDLRLALAPGDVTFACERPGSGEWLTAGFDLRDPDELWTPAELDCPDPDSGVFETAYREEPFERTARRALSGLLPLDLLVVPGYPANAWHGELHVVVRDERVVGRVARALNEGTWNVSVDACVGSELTQGAMAETGAT